MRWPDHSCPQDPIDLIDFVRLVQLERKTNGGTPMIVHCSAGVGRTGTFIALDMAMQRIRVDKKVNIYETVKQLRKQRMKMVQTFSQYLLLYQCVVLLLRRSEDQQGRMSFWRRLPMFRDRIKVAATIAPLGPVHFDGGTHNVGILANSPLRDTSDDTPTDAPEGDHNHNHKISPDLSTTSSSNSNINLHVMAPVEHEDLAQSYQPDDSIM